MARVRYIYPKRSDGVLEVKKGGKTETNAPTAEQLQHTKNGEIWVWYQEVPFNDPKHLDWRKKLGGLMIRSIYEQVSKNGAQVDEPDLEEYVLATLPEHYRLFEHCRQLDLDRPGAGGNRDRRDAYLYGHPDGRKKRFRSPGEFLPHLEWLGTDKGFDHTNCKCKLCTSDEAVRAGVELAKMLGDETGITPEFAKEQDTAKVSNKPAAKKKDKAAAKEKHRSTTTPQAPIANIMAPAPQPTQPSVDPSPLPPLHHSEQAVDLQWGGPFFRIGEVVWYMQPKSMSLAIGVILSREASASQGPRQFLIQPLSSPTKPQERLHVGEDRLYPWLAFSTPAPKNEQLHGQGQSFDSIRWSRLPQDDNIIVDGSIFGALAADITYTVVQPLTDPGAQTMEFEYNGIYFGGELIWVGDAVRYQSNLEEDRTEDEILIVHRIVNRIHTGSKPAEIRIVGDVYERRNSTKTPEPPSENLPARIRKDIQAIQELHKSLNRKGMDVIYKQGQIRTSLDHVLGRLYESRLLMHVVRPDLVKDAMETGNYPASGNFLNARGAQKTLPPGNPGVRRNERVEAFSSSVPNETHIQIDFSKAFQANEGDLMKTNQQFPPPNPPGADYMQIDQNFSGSSAGAQQSVGDFIQTDQMDEHGYGTMF